MRGAGRSSCVTGAVAESVVRLIAGSAGACAERIVGSGVGGPCGVLARILTGILVRVRAGPAGIHRRGRQLLRVTALGVRAARLRLPRILLRRVRLRCRVAFTGGGVAAEPGARGGTEPTTCCLGIGVAPMRSALVRGKLWQVVYSSKLSARAIRPARRSRFRHRAHRSYRFSDRCFCEDLRPDRKAHHADFTPGH